MSDPRPDHDLDALVEIVEAVAANEPYYAVDGIDAVCVLCDAEVVETLPSEYAQHHETCPYRMAGEYLRCNPHVLYYDGTFPMGFLRSNETVRRGGDDHIIIAAANNGILNQTHIRIGQVARRRHDGSIEVTDG